MDFVEEHKLEITVLAVIALVVALYYTNNDEMFTAKQEDKSMTKTEKYLMYGGIGLGGLLLVILVIYLVASRSSN